MALARLTSLPLVEAMMNHEHFKELCAIAALGQISEKDLAELEEHARVCASCRTAYADYADILGTHLPLIDTQSTSTRKPPFFFRRSSTYIKRFIARTKELGFQPSGNDEARQTLWDQLSGLSSFSLPLKYVSAAIVFLLIVGGSVNWWRENNAQRATDATRISSLGDQNAALRQRIAELLESQYSLEAELSKTHSDKSSLSASRKELKDQLQQASVTLQLLRAELETAEDVGSQTRRRLEEAERFLSGMNQELLSLREARLATEATAQAQIENLTRRLGEQAQTMERERRLLVADRDIRELMGARNLHINDVFDIDGQGKNRRSFGRVFYTEGRSLIFYAFDLDAPALSAAKHSFQAWGSRQGSRGSAVSLGIFYIDNAAQKRWVLKFDDPAVLNQIDAVFVTVEPPGGGSRPTGEELLYAYLGDQANHP